MIRKISVLAFLVFLVAITGCKSYSIEGKTKFIIGSGTENGGYYPVAVALCEVFNKHNLDKNVVCEAKMSNGAAHNLEAVENGEFDIGISQANLQYDAYNGDKSFAGRPHKKLRTLLGIHDEYLTIIVKNNSQISSFSDLRGKKINIGNIGSGSSVLFEQMVEKLGWNMSDFKKLYQESGSDIDKVLCPGIADAAVYFVGHPNKSFKQMLSDCDTKLVALSEFEIKEFVSISPIHFHSATIPEKVYESITSPINTFASQTILTASAELDKRIVENFIFVISKYRSELVKIQPLLTKIKFYKKDSVVLAPLHEGITN